MRVQREGQSLRVRILDVELGRLLEGGRLANETCWPDGRDERQWLLLGDRLEWRRDESGWGVLLPETEVRALAARLPSREGLSWALPVPGGRPLRILFDVDVRRDGKSDGERDTKP